MDGQPTPLHHATGGNTDPACICPPPGYSWSAVVVCPQHGRIVPVFLQPIPPAA